MTSETRIVRPYVGLDRIQESLADARLLIGGEPVESSQRLIFPPEAYLRSKISLELVEEPEKIEEWRANLQEGVVEAGYEAGDLELLVVASSPRLKISEIAYRLNLGDLSAVSSEISLATEHVRSDPFSAPFGGCRIDVYVCLGRDLEPVALRAWRCGTWLSHTFFRVETDLGDIGFTPIPLDDERRSLLGLDMDTIRYAVIEGPLDADQGDNAIELYVDEDLLARLALSPMTKAAKAFQAQLFIDAMTAVVYKASTEMKERSSDFGSLIDIEGSVYERVLDRLANSEVYAKEQFFEKTKSNPAQVVAHIEGLVSDLRKNIGSLLTGGNQ